MRNRANLTPAADVFIRVNTQGNRGDGIANFATRHGVGMVRGQVNLPTGDTGDFHKTGFLFNGVWWIISCVGRIVNDEFLRFL